METPSSAQTREELERKLQHMKKKYAHIQKKLQKSVKQKKVKAHVHRKLAEQALLQLAEGDASPANVCNSRYGLGTSVEPQSSGSLCIGPLQLDDSVAETPNAHREGGVKLNRKCASSGRLKKRRSVSFVLKEDEAKVPVSDVTTETLKTSGVMHNDKGDEVKIETEQAVRKEDAKLSFSDDVRGETLETSAGEHTGQKDEVKDIEDDRVKSIPVMVSFKKQEPKDVKIHSGSTDKDEKVARNALNRSEASCCDIQTLHQGHESKNNIPEDLMCVEETQNLSQLLTFDRQCDERKPFDPVPDRVQCQGYPTGRSDQNKLVIASETSAEENTKVASRSESSTLISTHSTGAEMNANSSISPKGVLTEHNANESTTINSKFSQNSNSCLQANNPNPETFSDPGPRTSRSRRRRARRSREITVSDISMKDVVQNSQSSQEGNHTWIEGLIYPVEYYVRKTRSMSGKNSPASQSQNLLPDGFDGLGNVSKGRMSGRGRRRQKAVSLQELVASSQSSVDCSLDNSSLTIASESEFGISETSSIISSSQNTIVTTSENKSLPNPNGKMESAHEDEINKPPESKSQNMSSQVSDGTVQPCKSEDPEESIQETQIKSQNKLNNLSSQASTNSNRSGRRNLSLSRRKLGSANNYSKYESNTKVDQNSKTSDKAAIAKQLGEQVQSEDQVHKDILSNQMDSEESLNDKEDSNSESKRTVLPGLSSGMRSQILSQTTDFVLPDSEFVELKLKKAQMSMAQQSPVMLTFHKDIEDGVTAEGNKSSVKRNSKVKDLKVCKNLKQNAVSSDLPGNSHLDKLDLENEQNSINSPVKDKTQQEPVSDSIPEYGTLVDQKPVSMNMNSEVFAKEVDIFSKPESGLDSHAPKTTTKQKTSDIKMSRAADYQTSKVPKSFKPSCQQSQGVLESQFSQSQCIPEGTPVFPRMGCSPGSPTSELTRPRVELSPTSPSEDGTMSFSPQGCSPRNTFKLGDSTSQESCPSRKRFGITDTCSDGTLEARKVNKETDISKVMHPPSIQIVDNGEISPGEHAASKEPSLDEEYSPPNNGVITPPMTTGISGNITHTSPFADVATATPYGKAEMPRCQSQCDPEDEEDGGEEMENQEEGGDEEAIEGMSGMKFAGCLQHDDFPSAIIGMCSCSVAVDDKEVTCLVVYSGNLIVLWITSDQYQWRIQASWTVLQKEQIASVQVVPCCEDNVIGLAIGGNFHQCCARLLKYNLSTGTEHQLDLAISSQQEDMTFQDLCPMSLDMVIVQTKNCQQGQQVYKCVISEDFRDVASSLMHRSESDLISVQRLRGIDEMVVMTCGQEILLWDCQSDCVLQKFPLPVSSDLSSTCLWACAESGVVFAVMGFKPADQRIKANNVLSPCVLLALNPATGKVATLHQYNVPGTSQDSLMWFTDGAVAQSKLAAQTSDGNLLIWDLYSAQPLAKTMCSAGNLTRIHWTLTQEGALLISRGSCVHVHLLRT